MKKSTYACLALVAVTPVLLTSLWWAVPLQVFGCAMLDNMHISAGLEKEEVAKFSLGYSAMFSIGLACTTPVRWPCALLAAIGAHFLGALAVGIYRELFVLPRARRDDELLRKEVTRTRNRR